ncbi:hypothetical protein D3C85_1908850 [compost metagenome]
MVIVNVIYLAHPFIYPITYGLDQRQLVDVVLDVVCHRVQVNRAATELQDEQAGVKAGRH